MTNNRDLRALAGEVESDMPAKVTLIYVDRNDELTDKQVDAIVRGDTDDLWESVSEWEMEARWTGACDAVDDLARDVIRRWEREDDADYSDLHEEFGISDERDALLDLARERDDSDVIGDLARNTGRVLLRMPIDGLDEDASMDDVDAAEFLRRIGFDATDNNVKHANEILAETSYPGAVRMGYALISVDVSDLWALPIDGETEVVIHKPHVYYGNPFAGSGWAAGPFDGTLTYKRNELTSDRDAFGYSWTEIAGPYLPAYDGEVTVKTEEN